MTQQSSRFASIFFAVTLLAEHCYFAAPWPFAARSAFRRLLLFQSIKIHDTAPFSRRVCEQHLFRRLHFRQDFEAADVMLPEKNTLCFLRRDYFRATVARDAPRVLSSPAHICAFFAPPMKHFFCFRRRRAAASFSSRAASIFTPRLRFRHDCLYSHYAHHFLLRAA